MHGKSYNSRSLILTTYAALDGRFWTTTTIKLDHDGEGGAVPSPVTDCTSLSQLGVPMFFVTKCCHMIPASFGQSVSNQEPSIVG